MDPFRTLLFLNGHPFGSSNTGIAVPASITTDPIADLHDGQAAPMQQGFTTTEEIGHGPIDVHIEKAPTFLFSNICFPSMNQHFHPCTTFFDMICNLFEHNALQRPENSSTSSSCKFHETTNIEVSDTSIGLSLDLSLNVKQLASHVRRENMAKTEKPIQYLYIF